MLESYAQRVLHAAHTVAAVYSVLISWVHAVYLNTDPNVASGTDLWGARFARSARTYHNSMMSMR